MDTNLRSSAQTEHSSLNKASNIQGTITRYPDIETIFDEFGVALDCIDRFETSERSTLQIALQWYKVKNPFAVKGTLEISFDLCPR